MIRRLALAAVLVALTACAGARRRPGAGARDRRGGVRAHRPGVRLPRRLSRQPGRGADGHRPRHERPLVPRRAARRHLRLDPGRRGLPARRRHGGGAPRARRSGSGCSQRGVLPVAADDSKTSAFTFSAGMLGGDGMFMFRPAVLLAPHVSLEGFIGETVGNQIDVIYAGGGFNAFLFATLAGDAVRGRRGGRRVRAARRPTSSRARRPLIHDGQRRGRVDHVAQEAHHPAR